MSNNLDTLARLQALTPKNTPALVPVAKPEPPKPARNLDAINEPYKLDALPALANRARTVAVTKSVAMCGRSPIIGHSHAYIEGLADHTVMSSNTTSCDNPWSCVYCALRIRALRGLQVKAIARDWASRHGTNSVSMLTLTVRHDRSMSLPDILAAEQRAHKALSRNRQLAEFKREVANYTYIRALEVKFSYANGWHPHLHELLFFDRPLTKQETTKFTSLVESVWIESVTKSLGRSPKAGVAANLITLPNGDASQYVTKMSAYICKTDGSHDDKPTHSYEPLELLQQGKVAKWQEFATAMKGKRSIVASVDLLKDLLFKEIWNMTLAEITEYEAEQTGAAIPEPPRIEWSLALEANLLYYVTSDYRIARSLYEAAEAGREAVELWARDTTDQTTYNAVQGLKYCRGSKDLLASTKPLADLLAPPVRPRNPVALTADEWKQNHDLNLVKLEAAREKSHKDLPEWIREPF